MRVRLSPAPPPERALASPITAPTPLLDPAGPSVILGDHDPFDGALSPSATSMYGPRGAALFTPDGPLWIADTGHHRLLGYRRRPTSDRAPADWVLGHPSFDREGRNAGGDEATARTLNMPTGIVPHGDGMIVCDSWNNRVLIWRECPEASNVPADVVLGQADFTGQSPNRGRADPGADTMHWPFQALIVGERLYVADAGNRRVLGWHRVPTTDGQPADFVLGQPSLEHRSDNGGGAPDAKSLRWPHDLAVVRGDLAVADAGDNRILVWDGVPTESGSAARVVIGQADFERVDHNQSEYLPSASSVSMPYGAAATDDMLLVADTANSRLLGYALPLRTGAPATALTGQTRFTDKGDNRWQLPVRDSVCWPYGLKVQGPWVIVADTGNHRVLLWRRPEVGHVG